MPVRDEDVEVDFFKSGGPGGQKKNVTESAVRVRHKPTGITVVETGSRSQHRNKQRALEELERRLAEHRKRRKPRRPTRPTRASREKRLAHKKHRRRIKQLRRPPEIDQ